MGTAGLDTEPLAGLLERKKVNCQVIEDDSAIDHCVLKIWTWKRPGVVAFVEYVNQGTEPRLVGMIVRPETFTFEQESYPLNWEKELRLSGKRTLDAEIITRWISDLFIRQYLADASIACPCCDNRTLSDAGNYDICLICFWEDDPIQRDDLDYEGGANKISLRQARKNFLEFGYCDEDAKRALTPNEYFQSK
jgi:hypothetical protein